MLALVLRVLMTVVLRTRELVPVLIPARVWHGTVWSPPSSPNPLGVDPDWAPTQVRGLCYQEWPCTFPFAPVSLS